MKDTEAYKIVQQRGASYTEALQVMERFDLALAIDQAAAYIQYRRLPIDRFGEFLETVQGTT